jgi:cell division protein FtsZ
MTIKLQPPKLADMRPRITVVGVGGAGGNAVNNMIASGLDGVEYVVANTDAQALAMSSAERRIQLGVNLTEGLGAGSKPEIGEAAAEEAVDEIRSAVAGSHMVFIAGGMGGGTGTGAAAVIARTARECDALTVAVVTKPFHFEGARRMRVAEAGIAALKEYVDTLIVIPNQNLFRVATEKTTFADAFLKADQVLYSGVACIVDLIVKDGLINLDFADVRTIMTGMGSAMMATGEGRGERRATAAAEEAIHNPLLDDVSLRGAKGLLLSIIGGRDMTLYEVDEAASRVRQEVDPEANIIVGATFDDSLEDRIRVAIVASGMTVDAERERAASTVPPPVLPDGSSIRAAGVRHPPRWTPEPPRAAPRTGTEPGSEVRHRLAEAIHAARGEDDASMANQHASPRELWRAPGGVVIEEGGYPPGRAVRPSRAMPPSSEAQASSGFRPAAPVPLKRGRPRIPEVDEFPPIAQRAYHAASNHDEVHRAEVAPSAPSAAADEQPRRRGLLQRLVDAGRGRRLEEDEPPRDSSSHPADHEPPAFARRSKP